MNRKNWLLLIITCILTTSLWAQEKKSITLEDVFKKNVFAQKSVYGINWMKDGQFYSSLKREGNQVKVVKINVATGKEEGILLDGATLKVNFSSYAFNNDETKALITSDEESIYRRSSKGVFHVVDLKTGQTQQLINGEKLMYATLSPDNNKVAFVKDNNLFYVDLATQNKTQITHDGKYNHIINGSADWVYEEEFSMAQAFEWSPDGKKIAFIRFDETEVPEFNMQTWGELYPQDYLFKYPKAGEKNAKVSIHVYDLDSQKIVKVDAGEETDIYLPRIYWTGDAQTLAFLRLNRLQNQLDLFYADTQTGTSQLILQEKSDTYVDLDYNDNLYFLGANKGFIRTSEKDGFKHIYLHDSKGKELRQITSGNWEVTQLVGVDEKNNRIYFISTEKSPLERNLYVVQMDGKNKRLLTPEKGTYSINMSKDFKYYIANFTDASTPLKVTLNEASGKVIKVLEDNEDLKKRLENYAFQGKTFFSFPTVDGTSLNGYMLKPANFDENKKYPVLMYVYGGPGSQNVLNNWGGTREFWHHHLAAE
jgi:dipeptidyl-peptidase-4